MSPCVAAVVVTYNSQDYVGTLLDSLPEAFVGVDHRVIVVDNGSSDDTVELLERRGDLQLVRSTNIGYGAGINLGARHCPDADAILVLNPDSTVEAGAVQALVEVLERPQVGIVMPRLINADGSLARSIRRVPTFWRAGGLSFTGLPAFAERVEDAAEYTSEQVVDWATGAVMLISAECFQALGGFDESYFLYSEETDLCLRAKDAGYLTVFTPTATAIHVGGGSGESAKTRKMRVINRVRLYRRRHGQLAAVAYFWNVTLNEVRKALFGERWAWSVVRALLQPSRRPAELQASATLIPR